MKTKKAVFCGLLAVIFALAFTACDDGSGGGGDTHTHTWGAWQSDATQHWKECTANDGAKGEVANHDYDTDYVCTVCGYKHTHSYSTEWSYDATQHWHGCSCGDKKDVADHDPDADFVCTICGGFSFSLGDTGPGGGKIFYVSVEGFTMTDDNSTAHYLEAAPDDIGELGWSWTNITGTATAIGTGRKNTAVILATDANAGAAKACNDYSNGGKTDWFLPSIDELNQLYVNRNSVGNMVTSDPCRYWSSSQFYGSPLGLNFSNGEDNEGYNNDGRLVRAVRAF